MEIFRGNIIIVTLELDDKSLFKYTIMGDEICELNFTSESFIQFTLGDFLIYDGQKFTINTPVKRNKIANNEYSYSLRFEGVKFELSKVLAKLDNKLEFPLNSNIEQIQDLILLNINEVSAIEWVKGTSSITPFYDFQISNENCLELLNKACLQFEVEFEVVAELDKYTLNVRDVIGIYEGVELSYKKGIFKIETSAVSSENIVTKLYGKGANKNIPASYGFDRLAIDPIENNLETFGTFEDVKIWEDIYPKFSGSVDSKLNNTFIDTNIDFDINAQLISGLVAKVVFLSGSLAGYEFEISNFNNSTKEVTLNYLTNDIGQILPDSDLQINIDDRYTFVDIYMPTTYVNAAEAELLTRAQAYLDKYSLPLTKYSVTIDARYLRQLDVQLYAGQKIKLVDLDMGINDILRIYSITQSLADPYNYQIELTDNLQTNRMIKLLYGQFDTEKGLQDLKKEIQIIKNN